MSSKMVDVERLCEMGWGILDLEAGVLLERGNCMMKFFIMSGTGYDVVMVPQPEVAGSAAAKDAVSREIRDFVRLRKADAVCFFSDMYLGEMPKSQLTPELKAKIDAIGMARASALGLIQKREALVLTVATRLETVLLCQFYRREIGKDNRERILLEEKERKDTGFSDGRFVHFFDDLPEGRA